ncbi:MAG: hypothetical protein ACFFD8_06400 [Candidatus Thorarchaeota archaeon]
MAIIMGKSKMLVKETLEGYLELPGFILTKAEEAIRSIEKFLVKLDLADLPAQTLYLTQVPLAKSPNKKVTAVIRVIYVNQANKISFPEMKFKGISQLPNNKQASNLTRLVAQWIGQIEKD